MSDTAAADLVDEFEAAIGKEIISRMSNDPSGELAAMPFARLLSVYANWRSRFPSAQARNVHVSAALGGKVLPPDETAALAAIKNAIATGGRLDQFLSRRVTKAYEPTSSRLPKRQRREDLDLLLAEWGIHHLHLSQSLDTDGFVQRTDDLLFVRFTDDDVYLIDVLSHRDWTNVGLLETIVRNWPQAGLLASADFAMGLANLTSANEATALRNAGVNRLIEIDGRIYLPGVQTLAGTSMDTSLRRMGIVSVLNQMREQGVTYVLNAVRPVSGGDLVPMLLDDRCGFLDGEHFYEEGRLV